MTEAVLSAGVIALLVAVSSWLWTFAMKRVRPSWQVLTNFAVFAITLLWVADCDMVLLRGKGYCVLMPVWPPFIGTPVNTPLWLTSVVSLLLLASVPALIVAVVRMDRQRLTRR